MSHNFYIIRGRIFCVLFLVLASVSFFGLIYSVSYTSVVRIFIQTFVCFCASIYFIALSQKFYIYWEQELKKMKTDFAPDTLGSLITTLTDLKNEVGGDVKVYVNSHSEPLTDVVGNDESVILSSIPAELRDDPVCLNEQNQESI